MGNNNNIGSIINYSSILKEMYEKSYYSIYKGSILLEYLEEQNEN
jgi:hypothetical protein